LTVNVGGEPIQWVNELKEPHTVTFIPASLITRLSRFNDSSSVMNSVLDSLNNNTTNLKAKLTLTPETQFLITNNNNKVFTSQKNNDDNITLNQSVSIFNSGIISPNNNNNNNNNNQNILYRI
jgi:plastocyanin